MALITTDHPRFPSVEDARLLVKPQTLKYDKYDWQNNNEANQSLLASVDDELVQYIYQSLNIGNGVELEEVPFPIVYLTLARQFTVATAINTEKIIKAIKEAMATSVNGAWIVQMDMEQWSAKMLPLFVTLDKAGALSDLNLFHYALNVPLSVTNSSDLAATTTFQAPLLKARKI